MKPYLLHIVAAALLAAAVADAKEIRKESGGLVVTGADRDGNTSARVQIERIGQGKPVTIQLDNTASVMDVLFVGPRRIVVQGGSRAEMSVPGDIFTVIDTEWNEIVDTFWGWDAVVSPDMRGVAYWFRIPPAIGQTRLSPALVAYDLTAPPTLNRLPDAASSPSERGIILYPESHRMTQRYWILLQESEPGRSFVSPIAWSPDSKRIAVVEHQEPSRDVRLVVVDVSGGLRQPSITAVPIAYEEFMNPSFWTAARDDYSNAYPSFRDLHFSEDGRSVVMTSWGTGPFAEKTMTVAIPSGSR